MKFRRTSVSFTAWVVKLPSPYPTRSITNGTGSYAVPTGAMS